MRQGMGASNCNKLTLLNNNCRSLNKNMTHIKDLITDEISILCLQEIWQPKISTEIPGFTSNLTLRTNKKGGGLATYISKKISHKCL